MRRLMAVTPLIACIANLSESDRLSRGILEEPLEEPLALLRTELLRFDWMDLLIHLVETSGPELGLWNYV